MSKLTSFTSASDALIQPTGATNGQVLTWNTATGQFEPTAPASTVPAPGSVTSTELANGSVTNVKLAANSVATANILDSSITSSKILDNSIIDSDLANGCVTSNKIVDGAVTLTKIQNVAPSTLIGNPTITNSSLQAITLGTNLSFSGSVLNAAGGSVLPNFTTNFGLRGDGTNVPVTDSRLNFATTDALDIVSSGTNGLRVVTSPNRVSLVGIGVGTAAANNLEIRGNTPPIVTNANGGWLELNAGASRGTGFSAIRFSVPDGTGTPGQAPNAVNLNWQMFATGTTNAVLEGLKDNNYIAGQLNKNIFVSSNGSGNASISADGTGALNIGTSVGTGNINVGTNSTTRVTNLNGLVNQPGLTITLGNKTANQVIPANANTVVTWATNATLGGSLAVSSVTPGTGTISFNRVGLYRVSGCLTLVSATINATGTFVINGVTGATTIPFNQIPWRVYAANVYAPCYFEFLINCTGVGTVNLLAGSPTAFTVLGSTVTGFTNTLSNITIQRIS